MGRGQRNKRKGSNAERFFAKEFRELGYDKCVTSRFGSKLLDDSGIDLIFIPFNVQIKAGYAKGLNYLKELEYIKEKMVKNLPGYSQEFNFPTLVIHRKDVGPGNRRTSVKDLIVMSLEDFQKISYKGRKIALEILKKRVNFEEELTKMKELEMSEVCIVHHKGLIAMTWEDFKFIHK